MRHLTHFSPQRWIQWVSIHITKALRYFYFHNSGLKNIPSHWMHISWNLPIRPEVIIPIFNLFCLHIDPLYLVIFTLVNIHTLPFSNLTLWPTMLQDYKSFYKLHAFKTPLSQLTLCTQRYCDSFFLSFFLLIYFYFPVLAFCKVILIRFIF